MSKVQLRKPFFVVNPKSYMFGRELIDLAKHTDMLAEKYDFDVLFTAPYTDLKDVASETTRLIVTAQHMDGIALGKGMGAVLPLSLSNVGVKATFLNHAEHPMTVNELAKAIRYANDLDIITIVCADSVEEAKAIAKFRPDVMVCEPNSLIGTGQVSDDHYMISTNKAVKSVSPETLVLQAAGISSGKNVYDAIIVGADGTGGTSGIVAAKDPKQILNEMFDALYQARKEM
ncbi:MAG: triose-phosphate isomerase [Breznakia sp.]